MAPSTFGPIKIFCQPLSDLSIASKWEHFHSNQCSPLWRVVEQPIFDFCFNTIFFCQPSISNTIWCMIYINTIWYTTYYLMYHLYISNIIWYPKNIPNTVWYTIFRTWNICSKTLNSGGVVAIHIQWICNLDFDFEENCLPKWVQSQQWRPHLTSAVCNLLLRS